MSLRQKIQRKKLPKFIGIFLTSNMFILNKTHAKKILREDDEKLFNMLNHKMADIYNTDRNVCRVAFLIPPLPMHTFGWVYLILHKIMWVNSKKTNVHYLTQNIPIHLM
jgi:hypothetical protein